MPSRVLLVLLLAAAAVRAGEPMRVVTGSTVVHDLAVRIGGERIAAACLLQPGRDPHLHQPVPEDVRRLAEARLVIINGLGFEGWFEGLAKEAGYAGRIVIASAGVEALKLAQPCGDHDHHGQDGHGHEHHGVDDPHAYHAIPNGIRYAENIRDALIEADAAGADGYRARAAAVIAELREADAWARQEFASIPRAQRRIIANHDALRYFAREYGFEILALNTASADSQPGAQDIAALVQAIRATGVKGIFLESGKNQKAIEQVAREAGVRLGAALHLDGVGPADGPAASYAGMFRANVQAILDALR